MISILCSFAPDMQSFLMPPNYFDDGYLAIFLRQLSRRGLLLFYCSQKLTELDTPISFPLSFVPPLYTQKMLQEKIASEKIIIALSYFCQTRYQENWRLSEVFLSLLLLLSFLNTPSNLYVEVLILKTGHSFFDGISPGFESTSTEKNVYCTVFLLQAWACFYYVCKVGSTPSVSKFAPCYIHCPKSVSAITLRQSSVNYSFAFSLLTSLFCWLEPNNCYSNSQSLSKLP